jgi:hypothetical protein
MVSNPAQRFAPVIVDPTSQSMPATQASLSRRDAVDAPRSISNKV